MILTVLTQHLSFIKNNIIMATLGEQVRYELQQLTTLPKNQGNVGHVWKTLSSNLKKRLKYSDCTLPNDKYISTYDLMTLGVKMIEQNFPDVDIEIYYNESDTNTQIPFIFNGKFARKKFYSWDYLFGTKLNCDEHDRTVYPKYIQFVIKYWEYPFPSVEEYIQTQPK